MLHGHKRNPPGVYTQGCRICEKNQRDAIRRAKRETSSLRDSLKKELGPLLSEVQ